MLNKNDYGVLNRKICQKETTKTQKVNAFKQFIGSPIDTSHAWPGSKLLLVYCTVFKDVFNE